MDIKELADILQRCSETKSIDELLKAAGVDADDIPGDSVKVKFCFDKEDQSRVQVKVLRDDIDINEMTLEKLEDYYEDLEDEYDELEMQEPEFMESDKYAEWQEKLDDMEDLMDDVEDRIAELKESR